MNGQDYIHKYGGKLGGWFLLKDIGGFENHLLPLYFVPYDMDVQNINEILPRNLQDNWLFRGSHPNDHKGLVDILDSPRVTGWDKPRDMVLYAFKANIEVMRDNANKQEIFDYSEFEGQRYDGRVNIGIQPFNIGSGGNIVEHPHERGTYLIDVGCPRYGQGTRPTLDKIVVVGNQVDERSSRVSIGSSLDTALASDVIRLYKRVRETLVGAGFIDNDYSMQMEFGERTQIPNKAHILFYQARPFLKFAESDFEIPEERKTYNCFGITDKDGLVLPVVRTMLGEGSNNIPYKFAWIVDTLTARMSPLVQPKNMVAFLPRGPRVYSLEHNTFRWVTKAKVSVLDEFALLDSYMPRNLIRVISNGLCYRLDKV